MAEQKSICQDCGSEYTVKFGDRCLSGKLIWSESHHCQHCGMAMERDGFDELPENLRAVALQQHGEWFLQVISGKKSVVGRVLRRIKTLTVKEISVLLAKIHSILFTGTQAEMEVIKFAMDQERIESIIAPVNKITEHS